MKEALLRFTVFSFSGQTHFQWECYRQISDSIKIAIIFSKQCTQTMFSMLVFVCRDPGDTMSKVSCCVEPSWCFKNSNFDAITNLPQQTQIEFDLKTKVW